MASKIEILKRMLDASRSLIEDLRIDDWAGDELVKEAEEEESLLSQLLGEEEMREENG